MFSPFLTCIGYSIVLKTLISADTVPNVNYIAVESPVTAISKYPYMV